MFNNHWKKSYHFNNARNQSLLQSLCNFADFEGENFAVLSSLASWLLIMHLTKSKLSHNFTPDYFSWFNTFFLRTIELLIALLRCNWCWESKARFMFCVGARESKICNKFRVVYFVIFLIDLLVFLQTSTTVTILKRKNTPTLPSQVELDSNTQARFSKLIKHQRLYRPPRTFILLLFYFHAIVSQFQYQTEQNAPQLQFTKNLILLHFLFSFHITLLLSVLSNFLMI